MPRFVILEGSFSVCRLEPDQPVPDWISPTSGFQFIARTDSELSIICASDSVPDGVLAENGFRLLRVVGPIPFDAIGVVAALTRPLADADIPVLVVSTFETDYLLIRDRDLDHAVAALRGAQISRSDL